MGFFSDLGKKTTETTNKIARETKLKMKVNENKGKITDIYEVIGKKVYEMHVREEKINLEDSLNAELTKLDELSKEIEEARIEILKLNQKKLCSKCSTEIENNALFCPKCGQKQQSEQSTVKEEALEKLEDSNVAPDKKQEAETVKEDLKEEINTESNSEDNETEN